MDDGGGSWPPDLACRPSHISLFEVLVSGRKPSLELGASSPANAGSALRSADMKQIHGCHTALGSSEIALVSVLRLDCHETIVRNMRHSLVLAP